MKRRTLSLALALSLLLCACSGSGVTALKTDGASPPVVAAKDDALDQALGDFGTELLRQTRREGENTLLSPLSILFCLSMCANGAGGDTLAEFEALLAGAGDLEGLNANCRDLLETSRLLAEGDPARSELYGITPGESTLSIANSLWLDKRVRAEDAFVGLCTGSYEAGLFSADFTQDGTRKEINRWISDNTGGHIKEALSSIDPSTVLALVNAVYFEGKWAKNFDPDFTAENRDFHLEDGSTAPVDLMINGSRTERYIHTEQEQGVLLPYTDGRLAFLALLPPEGTALTDYLNTLDGTRLTGLITGAEEEEILLLLPKFTAYWQGSLVEPLKAMGLEQAFDPERADFSGMGTGENGYPLYLNAVEHGAGIEVDEQGTKAFAFTFVGAACGGAAPQLEELCLDRPFVYGIVDMERGIPLFLGTFETP